MKDELEIRRKIAEKAIEIIQMESAKAIERVTYLINSEPIEIFEVKGSYINEVISDNGFVCEEQRRLMTEEEELSEYLKQQATLFTKKVIREQLFDTLPFCLEDPYSKFESFDYLFWQNFISSQTDEKTVLHFIQKAALSAIVGSQKLNEMRNKGLIVSKRRVGRALDKTEYEIHTNQDVQVPLQLISRKVYDLVKKYTEYTVEEFEKMDLFDQSFGYSRDTFLSRMIEHMEFSDSITLIRALASYQILDYDYSVESEIENELERKRRLQYDLHLDSYLTYSEPEPKMCPLCHETPCMCSDNDGL